MTGRATTLASCALLCTHACTFYNEPPPDSKIDEYFDSVERCQHDPTGIACCSRTRATLTSGLSKSRSGGDLVDWTVRGHAVTRGVDERAWISQHALQITRGATLELDVRGEGRECDTADPWSAADGDHATLEIAGRSDDPTSTWISYDASGRLLASLAGETYDECQRGARLRIQVDLRPGVIDRQDVILGSLGIAPAESDDPRDVQWLEQDVSLGPVRAFMDGQQIQLRAKGDLASPADVRQYQGTCASASVFEALQPPFEPTRLGAADWASTLGETALAIAPAIETPQESWELLFSGERVEEVGVSRRRAIGYSKRFGDGDEWVSVPSEAAPLVGASASNALTLDPDYREPSIALSKPGERAIAYTTGRGATHLEVGRLIDGEVRDVQTIDAEWTRGACVALSQPALVTRPRGGYWLYFTCCSELTFECGSGAADDTLWFAALQEDLQPSSRKDARPRRVEFDREGARIFSAGVHVVSAEPIAMADEVRMWLVVQDELQDRAVLLAKSGKHPYEFSFHTPEPVLDAVDLCPDELCRLESVAIALAPDARSLRLLALVRHTDDTPPRQLLHVLSQPLEVPW